MTRRLYPARLTGRVTAPPSKSAWHRALICRFLAGQSLPEQVSGDDVKHTLAGLRVLQSGAPVVDCGDSGATLRFLLPLAMALGRRNMLFTGEAPVRALSGGADGAGLSRRRAAAAGAVCPAGG